jgi:uncharacterized protein
MLQRIADQLQLSKRQVENIRNLTREGGTIPFIARYRKEATGNLDEVLITRVVDQLEYFEELEKRKETVIRTIESAGKLTESLKERILQCYDATVLEDIYLPFKPKRKTRAAIAIEKGLEPLAKRIFEQDDFDPEQEARQYLGESVKDTGEAIQGASDIIAEWISENEDARNSIRKLFQASGRLVSKVLNSKKEEENAQKYRDYFSFSEPLANCPSHRLLAIRRGEKEGFLVMSIEIDREEALRKLEKIFVRTHTPSAKIVAAASGDGLDRLLHPSVETEFALAGRKKAEEEAIQVFAENLRQLLLAPPLGGGRILAIDPGNRTGCKLAVLDDQGNFLHYTTIFPHPPQMEREQSITTLKALVKQFAVDAIAVGSGTAGRETEALVRQIDFEKAVSIFLVNESGASIYSASELAREEFPELDLTVRGAISIGRRLMDPLSELVKIDPKSIGVGQYQHDVNQPKLKDALDRVVESCVNFVGVDLNTSSRHLLGYVSGLGPALAKNIVAYRAEHGPFRSREELKKVSLMGPKAFEQSAGFLRIPGAANPLDASAVHPESYPIVETMARDLQSSVSDLITQGSLRDRIAREKYISGTAGEYTINDIFEELQKPGRDPRSTAEVFRFDDSVHTIEDLRPGMKLPGIVTNITNFGAFVDIGVKQDGLVHLSNLSARYVQHPNEIVRLQQKVWVTVMEVDVARRRISLSMKEETSSPAARSSAKKSSSTGQIRKPDRNPASQSARGNPTDFADKLADLKKKFNR